MPDSRSKKQKERDNLSPLIEKVCGALIGVDLVGLIQLAGIGNLDLRLTVASIFFAASLPVLTVVVAMRLYGRAVSGEFDQWVSAFGVATAIIGVSALIFHVSVIAGVTFGVLFIACSFKYMSKLRL